MLPCGQWRKENAEQMHHLMPAPLTSFVGRQQELVTLYMLFDQTRLLTLSGAAGMGKTRLALELAHHPTMSRAQIYWIDVATCVTDTHLITAVTAVLGVQAANDLSPITALTQAIADRPIVLLFDTCEHVVAACASLCDALLQKCSQLRIIATSRERLGSDAETTFVVPPLTLLLPEAAYTKGDPFTLDALRLFWERQHGGVPAPEPTPHEVDLIARICWHLEGIPLAIELAAARCRHMPLEQIADLLDHSLTARFPLLTAGTRTAPQRHATLRAALDWSYALLTPLEQRLLRRLAVFQGGCLLAAAEAVCAYDGIAPEQVLPLLGQLIDKSLLYVQDVQALSSHGAQLLSQARYRFLDTIQAYAYEHLHAAGEATAAHHAHMTYIITLAHHAEVHLRGPDQLVWLAHLDGEMPNIDAVLRYALDQALLGLASSLWWYWVLRMQVHEGLTWFQRFLGCGNDSCKTGPFDIT